MILSSLDDLAVVATGRTAPLFDPDVACKARELADRLAGQRVLVIGGAGSIGSATVRELSRFQLAGLHVIDLNENGLTELVRDLRGGPGGLAIPDFRTLPLDFGSPTMRQFVANEPPYDFVLNFAAVKHVRSEKDPYSLVHMLDTNVLKAEHLLAWLDERGGTRRYFSVSTDKAANPVSIMGASKRAMEHVIFARQLRTGVEVASARFANVAFSEGSLLAGWLQRLTKRQPIAVPASTQRYFLSLREAGQFCLIAGVCAPSGCIVVPALDPATHLIELERVARALIERFGFQPTVYHDEARAREATVADIAAGRYPLLLTLLDTAGEKPYEEFVSVGELAEGIGLPNLRGVSYRPRLDAPLEPFLHWLGSVVSGRAPLPRKTEFVEQIARIVPELKHVESEKQLDQRL